jgi:hypothetical protein
MPSIYPRIRNRIGASVKEKKGSKNVRRIVIVICVTLITLFGVLYNSYFEDIQPIFIVSVTWLIQLYPLPYIFFPWTMRPRSIHSLGGGGGGRPGVG